jgi:hypothetical protein
MMWPVTPCGTRQVITLVPGGIGQGLAVQLVAGAGVELEVAGQRCRVGAGLPGGLPQSRCSMQGQFGGMVRHGSGQSHQQASALLRAGVAPQCLQTLPRGAGGLVDIVLGAALHLLEGLAVGRVDDVNEPPAGAGHGGIGNEVVLHGRIVRQSLAAWGPRGRPCV